MTVALLLVSVLLTLLKVFGVVSVGWWLVLLPAALAMLPFVIGLLFALGLLLTAVVVVLITATVGD